MKLATGNLHPLAIVFWRMLIAGFLLSAWCLIRGYSWRIARQDLLRMIAVGLLSATAHLLVVWGVSYSHAADASLLYVVEPTWGILLATIVLKERFSRWMGFSIALILIGVVLMTLTSQEVWGEWTGRMVSLGNLIIVAGLLCEGSFSVAIRPVVDRYPAPLTLTVMLISCVFFLFLPTLFMAPRFIPIGLGEWSQVAYLAIFCSVVGYLGWIVIMRRVPVNVMYFTIFIQPISGPAIAWMVLGERLTSEMILSGSFLITGLLIAITSHLSSRRAAEQPAVAV